MGWFLDILQYAGIVGVMAEEGTVFGGKLGDGVHEKITFIIPPKKPKPPETHTPASEKHYPEHRINRYGCSECSHYHSALDRWLAGRKLAYSF